ncbi:hypothetical protein SAMD00019534_046030 [Acytostelium subglobosum LB1]|uniref:hypothetical protein n=1 Tax=Acytostelium subglobosum LB1 TaxID=1410327 RepID=UPI000645116F|nr:hypothetical protein SAMD00019534_046030 [Acytostelium subglobosum LB1]GAM21428.1 hypothetical protein SAMD00019534_046030 [Acytostelium subglobosum LB1]|eukprot:XP_012755547.1 hypothetical protein SAMD00019534_046030 [Acytostelium subglobosum LB1]
MSLPMTPDTTVVASSDAIESIQKMPILSVIHDDDDIELPASSRPSTTTPKILNNMTLKERDCLQQFKLRPVAKDIPDHYLMVFLMAKKLDMDKAAMLLANNISLRKKLDIPFPMTKEFVNQDILQCQFSLSVEGISNDDGTSIGYMKPSNIVPSNYSLKDYIAYMMWITDQTCHYDYSIQAHRSGLVLIVDLKHFSLWHHFDKRLTTQLEGKSLQNIFPGRIQSVYLLNPPFYLKALITLARNFVKSKIISRIQIISNSADIGEYLDAERILCEYGGHLEYDYPSWFESLPKDY